MYIFVFLEITLFFFSTWIFFLKYSSIFDNLHTLLEIFRVYFCLNTLVYSIFKQKKIIQLYNRSNNTNYICWNGIEIIVIIIIILLFIVYMNILTCVTCMYKQYKLHFLLCNLVTSTQKYKEKRNEYVME